MARQARHRALAATLGALTLAVAGCGTDKDQGISGGGKVIGKTLTVYSLTTDPSGSNRDFIDAEKLALAEAGGRAGSFSVNFTSLDLGTGDETQAAAARRAIGDAQIIAAIVDATNVTVPLFNAAGILQVASSGDPKLVDDPQALPSGKRTAAMVPSQAAPAGFAARFRTEFGRDPQPSAAAGFEAMRSVLAAVTDAGAAANDRDRVVDSYFN